MHHLTKCTSYCDPYLYSDVPSPLERNVLEFRISKLFGQMTRADSGSAAADGQREAAAERERRAALPESILPSMARLIGARLDGGIDL